jgi:hypothetical protein
MTPEKDFYTIHEKYQTYDIEGETAYGFVMNANGKQIICYSLPDKDTVGYGSILIPVRAPRKIDRKKINHPLGKVVDGNQKALGNSNHIKGYLSALDIDAKKFAKSFEFTGRSIDYNVWFLEIKRIKPDKLESWREALRDQITHQRSAHGLVESFVRNIDGWRSHAIEVGEK